MGAGTKQHWTGVENCCVSKPFKGYPEETHKRDGVEVSAHSCNGEQGEPRRAEPRGERCLNSRLRGDWEEDSKDTMLEEKMISQGTEQGKRGLKKLKREVRENGSTLNRSTCIWNFETVQLNFLFYRKNKWNRMQDYSSFQPIRGDTKQRKLDNGNNLKCATFQNGNWIDKLF